MDLEKIDLVRKLAIISLFSDDDLMDIFVLKGGNVLNIVYGINNRASKDIDVSMSSDFTGESLSVIEDKLKNALLRTFGEHKIHVFDISLTPKPTKMNIAEGKFWGGYNLRFKLIDNAIMNRSEGIESLRRRAIPLDKRHTKTFSIDISKYEFCDCKQEAELDGYTIYVYTPAMVVFEKLRALCQQMSGYKMIVESHHPRPRSRDFYDIHSIMEHFNLDLISIDNKYMLEQIFAVKKVPISFLGELANQREFHRDDFNTVRDTVSGTLKDYDFYFEYVCNVVNMLKPLWEK